ncbi:cyclopropane-fatty-acyl-phospholipid synthase family protein [Amycolatopsis sp.]|uniref:cyclopropane-fatty-acyl-phospholipid synthase family protein n=1 Tax=Amycolatopsis sp. TaxID=37632 RepID=UPI002B713903|nr:cyclopropane-fatty-acyl-phospholipid synthase family protein [Amycolatopsis sp.]HVV13900.1 cyclopropane-fatty-acyl-phospholipid synthase family protein [Amycolatopsis sp.]
MTVTASEVLSSLFGGKLPVGLRAWDGSTAGQDDCPKVVVTRRALRRLLWNLSELGLARAYVSGDLDVEGDLTEGLRLCWQFFRSGQLDRPSLREVARAAVRLRVIGPRPRPPAEEARPAGRLHTRARDKSVIAHHYDLGNDFYQLILDPSMAYSCAYFANPGQPLADAQRDKLDLVCRKLGLRPGMRLLDVGCGWGALLAHATKHYGVDATGVTLSAQQAEHVRGLGLNVRLQDYRDLSGEPFDAIASLEMGEHVGAGNYPRYAATLHRMLRPGGKLLLQQMSRGTVAPGGGAFIESYIAPDMTMVPVWETLARLEAAGFEIRGVEALREHYVWTVRAWAEQLEKRRDEVVALAGEGQLRVWRLYLAGGALAFEENRMGVNQILAQA